MRIKLDIRNLTTVQKHFFAILLFAILATVLIFSWFRYGYLYGGGDVGIPAYDPGRILNIARFVWWDVSAPGTTVPQGLTSVPLQFVQAILQNLQVPFVIIQALFFWVILFTMGYGMFLMALTIFSKEKVGLALLSGLFYMLNPYMMIQVWHRFIHNTFFLAAALPFFLIFFRSWIKNGRYSSLLLFLVANFIAVYIYGTIAFIVTIFTLLVFICGFEILFPWKGFANSGLILVRSFIGTVAWLVIHSWWLLPVLNVAPAVLSSQHSVVDNLSTLLSISSQTIIPYSLLGVNPFYLYQEADFGKIYDTYFFRSLPWLSLIFLVPGFIRALKNGKWAPWALLATLGVFLAKGATSPFGYPYIFGFSNFFPLGVLRNPFEKMGILIPFTYAILIPLGIEWYLENTGRKFKLFSRLSIAVILVLILIVNLWPMWLGKIFGKYEKLAFVQVPNSYIKADEYIKNQQKTGRILHLPLTISESATYNWEYGYNGVESSQLYFNSLPSISRGLNTGKVDDALSALSQIFNLDPIKEDKVVELLQAFNIRFLVLHKDMEWRGGYLTDPKKLEVILNSFKFITKKGEFGDLDVYEINDNIYREKIYYTEDPYHIVPGEENSYWPWLIKNSSGDIIYNINKAEPQTQHKGFIVLPKDVYSYIPYDNLSDSVIDELPAVKFLPNSFFYPFIKLKEGVLLFIMPETEKFQYRMTIAGKRIAEAYKVKQKNLNMPISSILSDYNSELPELKSMILTRKGAGLANGQIPLESIFAKHLKTLELIKTKTNSDEEQRAIEDTKNRLIETLKDSNIMPYFKVSEANSLPAFGRQIFRFSIPVSGTYELLQAHQNSKDVYPNKLSKLNFQVDDIVESLNSNLDNEFLSFGKVNFDNGFHEISIGYQLSQNLINSTTDLIKNGNITVDGGEIAIESAQHDVSSVEYQIKPVTGGGWYQLSFEAWIKLGDKFKVRLIQDSDPVDPSKKEEKLYSFNKIYSREAYNNYWNKYTVDLHIRPTTQKASIEFIVEPWDDCNVVLIKKILCNIKSIRIPFEHPGISVFKNITIQRQLKNPIFLRSVTNSEDNKNLIDTVAFSQKSAILYSGKFSAKKPGYLIFSETFHPGWKLELSRDEKFIPSQKVVSNLYGNGWFIDETGEYNFKLEFTPQRDVIYGIIISGICFVVVSILTTKQILKNE